MINFRTVCLIFFSSSALVSLMFVFLVFLCPMGKRSTTSCDFFFFRLFFFCLFTYLALKRNYERVTLMRRRKRIWIGRERKKKNTHSRKSYTRIVICLSTVRIIVWCGVCVVHFFLVYSFILTRCSMFMFKLFFIIQKRKRRKKLSARSFQGLNGVSVSPES